MITIIAGSRDITNYQLFLEVVDSCPWEPSTILTDGHEGVAALAQRYAEENNLAYYTMGLDGSLKGKKAAKDRNRHMLLFATHAIVIWHKEQTTLRSLVNRCRKDLQCVIRVVPKEGS